MRWLFSVFGFTVDQIVRGIPFRYSMPVRIDKIVVPESVLVVPNCRCDCALSRGFVAMIDDHRDIVADIEKGLVGIVITRACFGYDQFRSDRHIILVDCFG
jgi:hypothetical protein